MEAKRPIVVSIAGFDPSGGAGVLTDVKTFEQNKVYGLGISTAQTLQTEDVFVSIRWEPEVDILKAIETMLARYDVRTVKIGIVENIGVLSNIISAVEKANRTIKIVWDTVIRSSSGFGFWNNGIDEEQLCQFLSKLYLITPNYNEAVQLVTGALDAKTAAEKLSRYCNVLLKGGHNEEELAVDFLYSETGVVRLEGRTKGMYAKHGSGCVLSSAIAANLALRQDLLAACKNAKQYIEQFLSSNNSLLGYHHV